MEFTIKSGSPEKQRSACVVVGVFDNRKPSLSADLIDRASGNATHLSVGPHPCGIAVEGDRAFVANAGDDSISEIHFAASRANRTIPIHWQGRPLSGSLPTALAIHGNRLFACNGGDNAAPRIGEA